MSVEFGDLQGMAGRVLIRDQMYQQWDIEEDEFRSAEVMANRVNKACE